MAVLKVERLEASALNMLIPIGFMLGAPAFGWLADRLFSNKANLLIGLLSILAGMWTSITFFPQEMGYVGLAMILFIMGAAAGGMATTVWGTVQESTPSRNLGTTTGLLNIFPLLGMAVMQGITGAMVDRAGRMHGLQSPAAFRDAFLICLGGIVVCLLLCIWIRRDIAGEKKATHP
jgi:MFS family permease